MPPQLRGTRADENDVPNEILDHAVRRPVPRARAARRTERGFSLIELITTMSVLAILLVVASPGLASLTSSNALSSAQTELAAAMMMARGEAMKRGVQVGVSATAPVGGAEFSGGWSIYVDSNGNGQYDAGETIVRQQPAYRTDVHIATTSGTTNIVFNSRGFLAPSSLITFNLCSSATSRGFQLRLEPVGLTDVAETTTTCS